MNLDDCCSICLDAHQPGTCIATDCGHHFHRTCLRRWLRRQASCPVCRAEVDRTLVEDENYVLAGPSRHRAAWSGSGAASGGSSEDASPPCERREGLLPPGPAPLK